MSSGFNRWTFSGGTFISNITNGPKLSTVNTAAIPNYSFSGSNQNTGMFLPANTTIGFSTNGTERVRIDSGGNVGIGTTTPAAQLDVQGTLKSGNSWSKNTPANVNITSSGTVTSFTMTCHGGPVLIFANFGASNLTSAAWNGTSFYIRVGSASGPTIRGVSNTTNDAGGVGIFMSNIETLYNCPAGSTTFFLTAVTNPGVTIGIYDIEFSAAELGLR